MSGFSRRIVRHAAPRSLLVDHRERRVGRRAQRCQRHMPIIGQPTKLTVQPADIVLTDGRTWQQVVVTGNYADGSVRDLRLWRNCSSKGTSLPWLKAAWCCRGRMAWVSWSSRPAQWTRVPVTVKDFDKPQPVSFRNEFIAALNVGGCNAGACHGTPSGKNGFKLSLRGFDPAGDYPADARRARPPHRRQQSRGEPDLAKGPGPRAARRRATLRRRPASRPRCIDGVARRGACRTIRPLPTVKKVEVLPGSRGAERAGPLAATRRPGNVRRRQRCRDVTRLTVFTSSDPAVAEVTPPAWSSSSRRGEVAILCRYLEEMVTVRLTYSGAREGLRLAQPAGKQLRRQARLRQAEDAEHPAVGAVHRQEFVRRAYLDVCGVLPTPDEVEGVPRPTRTPDKRAKLIDALLERPEYADFWTLKWSDVLRSQPQDDPGEGDARLPAVAARATSTRTRRFDEMVRELLTASGSTFANPPANYYRIARDPTEPGRDDGPALLRRPHAVREVPQPPVRALDAGRLLQHGRLLRPREARSPTRLEPGKRRNAGRRRGHLRRPRRRGDAAAHRQGDGAEVHGRRRRRRSPPSKDRREVLADVADGAATTRSSPSRSSTASGST